jgi:hypothetical protein
MKTIGKANMDALADEMARVFCLKENSKLKFSEKMARVRKLVLVEIQKRELIKSEWLTL